MKTNKVRKNISLRGTKQSSSYRNRAILWLSLGVALLFIIPTFLFIRTRVVTPQSVTAENEKVTVDTPVTGTEKPTNQYIPTSYDISMPYAPQAPFSNWTVHEESCEEAALTMYHEYLEGNTLNVVLEDGPLDLSYKAMKSWQVQNYGKEPDLTMTALGTFAQSYYGYTPTVKKSITADDIKAAIAAGNPVIVPVMTHSLENNMYGPVSVYHVLLIKGYDATGVITNDAGVGNGQNHHYTWDILWQAIDAQTAKMGQGRELLYLTK